MIRNITTIPNKILDKQCHKIADVNSDVLGIIKDLKETLEHSEMPGAGIAANQIGLDKAICIVRDFKDDTEEETFKEYVLINPEIKIISKKEDMDWEGCLSVPDTYGLVKRFKKIKVSYIDENGKSRKMNIEGFFARTIQHEVDHLNGILFTSKIIGKPKTEKELDELFSKSKRLG